MDPYYDIRSDFWKKHFKLASPYGTYLEEEDPSHKNKWIAMEESLPDLTQDQITALNGYNRKLMVLVYSGAWCGDCVRQGPMIKKIADAAENVDLRFIDRDESQELKDELRIVGAMRVPMVVFLNEEFHEAARVGDRLLLTYRRKYQTETGAACDTGLILPPKEELAAEMGLWVEHFERVLLMLRLSPMLRNRYQD